jgi:hypothetical protein
MASTAAEFLFELFPSTGSSDSNDDGGEQQLELVSSMNRNMKLMCGPACLAALPLVDIPEGLLDLAKIPSPRAYLRGDWVSLECLIDESISRVVGAHELVN